MDGQGSEPTRELNSRDGLTPVFDDLNRYEATMHFNGQSAITPDGNRASGESYCIAHHLFTDDGERKLTIAWLRYRDTFPQGRRRPAICRGGGRSSVKAVTLARSTLRSSTAAPGHRGPRERGQRQMPAPTRREGSTRAIQETSYSPQARMPRITSGSVRPVPER